MNNNNVLNFRPFSEGDYETFLGIEESDEPLNLAMAEIPGKVLVYQHKFIDSEGARPCLIVTNRVGLEHAQLHAMVERWLNAGGIY